MKKKYGKNEASDFGTKNTAVMIVSLISVGLFIGMAIQPVVANPMPNQQIESSEEECIPCKDIPDVCKTCKCAIDKIIDVTKKHVDDNFPYNAIPFPGWRLELALTIFDGVIKGIYSIDKEELEFIFKEEELLENITYYMDRYLDPHQNHTFTKVVMTMTAILTAVSSYLFKLCVDLDDEKITSPIMTFSQHLQSVMNKLLVKIKLIFSL